MAKVQMPFIMQKPTGAIDSGTYIDRIATARGLNRKQVGLTLKVTLIHTTGQLIVEYDDTDPIMVGNGISQAAGQGIINAIVRGMSEHVSG